MATTSMDGRVNRAVAAFCDHDADALLNEVAADGSFADSSIDGTVSGDELRGDTHEMFEGFSDVRLAVERAFTSAAGDGPFDSADRPPPVAILPGPTRYC